MSKSNISDLTSWEIQQPEIQSDLLRSIHQIDEIDKIFVKDNILAQHAKDGDTKAFIATFKPLASRYFNTSNTELCSQIDNAFLVACIYGHIDIVDYCLEEGFESNTHDSDNITALYYACVFSNNNIAEMLIDYGASVEGMDEDFLTPFMVTCLNQNLDGAILLLQKGAIYQKKFDFAQFYEEEEKPLQNIFQYLASETDNEDFLNNIVDHLKHVVLSNQLSTEESNLSKKRPRSMSENYTEKTIKKPKTTVQNPLSSNLPNDQLDSSKTL